MERRIPYSEYRRRVFNEAVLTVLVEAHGRALGYSNLKPLNSDTAEDQVNADIGAMATKMARKFFADELCLDKSTVSTTKKKLCEACHFLSEAAKECEEIADAKAEDAQKCGVEILDAQEPELSEEDKAVLDQLFTSKGPEPQIAQIRDATAKALLAEEQRAKAVKDAYDLANSQSLAKDDPGALEETVKRIQGVGPTSLMNAIMNNVSSVAIKEINESGSDRLTNIGAILRENSEEIKTRAVAIYALMEEANVLGIHRYTPKEVEKLSYQIFYEQ